MKTRILHYSGEGYFPQAREKYKEWMVICEVGDDDGDYCLSQDWSNPHITELLAQAVRDEYETWHAARPTPTIIE